MDLTNNVFELLKYDKSLWEQIWSKQLFFRNPTLYGKYFLTYGIDKHFQFDYIENLNRIDLDKLYIFWESNKNNYYKELYKFAGKLYKDKIKNFGIFLFVGYEKKPVTIIKTSKGHGILIDIWYMRREFNGKEYSAFREMDEITALLSEHDFRI